MRRIAFLLMVGLLFAGAAIAEDAKTVTVEGKVMCAKCALKEEGREKCQNVLVVEKGDEVEHYYLAATAANEEFGEVCMAKPVVRVTGTLSEKDGHTWLAAEKIEPVEDAG